MIDLCNFITSGPVFAMVWQGDQVIALSRTMIGKTNSLEAAPGTIRGDFAVHTNFNLIHGSDSTESAEREIGNYFNREELIDYSKHNSGFSLHIHSLSHANKRSAIIVLQIFFILQAQLGN